MFIKNAYLCHNCHHNLVHLNHDHSQNIVYLYKRKKQKVRNCLYLLIQVENYALFKCLKFFFNPPPQSLHQSMTLTQQHNLTLHTDLSHRGQHMDLHSP